jgi:hypothetical protein
MHILCIAQPAGRIVAAEGPSYLWERIVQKSRMDRQGKTHSCRVIHNPSWSVASQEKYNVEKETAPAENPILKLAPRLRDISLDAPHGLLHRRTVVFP